jgi:predicted GNAT family acetyltransferase
MVRTSRGEAPPELPGEATMRPLADGDVPAMTDLVTRTEPGPWRPRTIELGGYVGIFHGDALVAMAGQRMHPPGYVEISAVCTDPSARRRGYASIVTHVVADAIAARGATPMLHVANDNPNARAVYEQLGFETVRMCGFSALGVPR